MKERFTPEQRLQFLKQFGVQPEMTAKEYRGIKYDLAAFDSQAGYGRLESEDGRHFIDYQVLSPDIIAIREGEQHKSENKKQIIRGVVTYLQNDILISYEPDYSTSRIDEETGETTDGEAVDLSILKRYEPELDIPLVGAYYNQGRLVSVRITDRTTEEDLREELLELRKRGIKPLHLDVGGPEFVFSEENPELVSIVLSNPKEHPLGAVEYEPEAILNEYVILDEENPDAYRITHENNMYAFRRLNWDDNAFWEVTIPESLSFEEIHSVATSDEWIKMRELYPVAFTRGKDRGIYLP